MIYPKTNPKTDLIRKTEDLISFNFYRYFVTSCKCMMGKSNGI